MTTEYYKVGELESLYDTRTLHRLEWTRDPHFEDGRAYCICGWVAEEVSAAIQRRQFIHHLEELGVGET